MGRNHARVLHELPNVELVGVADADLDAACQVAAVHATRGYASLKELLKQERPEAVTVAVPTENHHETAEAAVNDGGWKLAFSSCADPAVPFFTRYGYPREQGH